MNNEITQKRILELIATDYSDDTEFLKKVNRISYSLIRGGEDDK